MLPPGIRAVVFDAVGTLIFPDPPAPRVYAEVGGRHDSRLSPEVIAQRFAAAFRREEDIDRAAGLRTSEARERERWQYIVAAVLDDVEDPAACFRELFEHFSRPEAWRCDPEATAVLRELARRGYALGLASNYDRRLQGVAEGMPELTPIQRLVISSEVGWRKPSPAFFASLCQNLALSPGQVLFVGDDIANDYEGARAAGLRALLWDPHGRAPAAVERLGRWADLLDV
jgi:putative hydrolase of the HAD superfamily